MAFQYRRQPLKSLFLLYVGLSILFVRLPYWVVTSLVPAWRPRRSWSMRRTIMVRVMVVFVDALFKTQLPPPAQGLKTVEKEASKNGFVWIDPTPELIGGEIKAIADRNGVRPERIHGFWWGAKGPDGVTGQLAGKGEKVVYYLHGGGFVTGHAGPKDFTSPGIINGFLEHFPGIHRVFAIEYRIASAAPFKPANPFPAALIDAVAGYHYLIHSLGFAPEDIIVSGDSGGGALAIMFMRYIASSRLPALPTPALLLLLCPTVEWVPSYTGPGSAYRRNSSFDYTLPFLASGYPAKALVGNLPFEEASRNSWISPGSRFAEHVPGTYRGFPPTCIHASDGECKLDSLYAFCARLEADIGSANVTYIETKNATHDHIAMAWHEPERTEALEDLARWFKRMVY